MNFFIEKYISQEYNAPSQSASQIIAPIEIPVEIQTTQQQTSISTNPAYVETASIAPAVVEGATLTVDINIH